MKIYRGDSDSQNIRQLKFSVTTADGLYTTLINSGKPRALVENGFLESIQTHAVGGWDTSHFLSFSKDRRTAERFAEGQAQKKLQASEQRSWNTLVATIDLDKLILKKNVTVGINHYQFEELKPEQSLITLNWQHKIGFDNAYNNRRSSKLPTTRNIWVIDVFEILNTLSKKGHPINQVALDNAEYEQEILVLPVDPFHSGDGLTAQLDLGCIEKFDFYNLV